MLWQKYVATLDICLPFKQNLSTFYSLKTGKQICKQAFICLFFSFAEKKCLKINDFNVQVQMELSKHYLTLINLYMFFFITRMNKNQI